MSPAWLFASLVALLPGGLVLFRLVVLWLSRGVPMWLVRLVGGLSLLLVVLSVKAGYLYDGVCHATPDSAGSAIAADMAKLYPVFEPSSVNGSPYYYVGSYRFFCNYERFSGQNIFIYCDPYLDAILYGVNTGPLPPPGSVEQPLMSFTVNRTMGRRHTNMLAPQCDVAVPPTSEDILYIYSWGAGSILTLWALGLAVGAARRAIRSV